MSLFERLCSVRPPTIATAVITPMTSNAIRIGSDACMVVETTGVPNTAANSIGDIKVYFIPRKVASIPIPSVYAKLVETDTDGFSSCV